MVFSSPPFLFLFLPALLALHGIVPRAWRNTLLLAASVFFYGFGEKVFVLIMLGLIAANWALGLWIDRARGTPGARVALAGAVVVNIGMLAVWKYANFLADNLNALLLSAGLSPVRLDPIALPIGISFYVFQMFAYVIDVYRADTPVQRNPGKVALYVMFFPQLIAGPIVRYRDVADQIDRRRITRHSFATGVRRFILGLGKKVLIANTVAGPADALFGVPPDQLTAGAAWLGVACYALQIYFDFSGYSDMAIGLGRMFGFRFLENFLYPYTSRSVTEFWRRWHISLSTWFRDYLYVPLGGNRRGPARTYFNLLTVFLLCGLWHGASWTFVAWGLFHGAFLVAERLGLGALLQRLPTFAQRAYTLLAVLVGWVFFRAGTFSQAAGYLAAMAGLSPASGLEQPLGLHLTPDVLMALVGGTLASTPLLPVLARWRARRRRAPAFEAAMSFGGAVGLIVVLAASATLLAADTYNPFIYFRF
jgi:alginate O-acetyltransferase complex protein AlgI